MRVGIVSVDSLIPNLALMRLSAWHKAQGDEVKLYDPLLDSPDLLYASKVFTKTDDFAYWPECEVVRGGTGYDIHKTLPDEIEAMMPDYSLFDCEFAIGFTTRGCVRRCEFCFVPRKEGKLHVVGDFYDMWQGQSHAMILDNNLTGNQEQFELVMSQIAQEDVLVDFSSGFDIRLLNDDMARWLPRVKWWKQIRFAFDNIAYETAVRRGIDTLIRNGVRPSRTMWYVLIGFDTTPEEDLYRVELLRSFGCDPFVMPYDKTDPYQKRFARWCNHKAIFKTVPWAEYGKRAEQTNTAALF